MHTINYFVDDEPQTTNSHELTPRQILENAGIDANSHYLVQIQGHHRISYEEKPDTPIHLHQQERFISVSTGPTPVS